MAQTILIVGAGPAGLTAAYTLQKYPKDDDKIIVLEASSHLGGIAATAVYHGNHMDLGGHRFFTKSEPVLQLWEELLPPQGEPAADELLVGPMTKKKSGGADPERTDQVLLRRRRVSRIYYLRHFFSYPIALSLGMLKNLGFKRLVRIGFSYLKALLFPREENSLADFYINHFGQVLYEMFFANYTEKIWGVSPEKIAPDWGSQRVKGLSILEILRSLVKKTATDSQQVETSLIEEFAYPKYGPGQMWDTMAAKIRQKSGQILLDRRVVQIRRTEANGFVVTAQDAAGQTFTFACDKIISSMAVCDLVRALPSVPEKVFQTAVHLPYRDFITVGLLCKKLLLKNDTEYKTVNNLVPDCWIYIQEHGVKLGRLQIFNNWSPYLVKDWQHQVWLGLEYFCNEGDELWSLSQAEFIRMAIGELAQIGIIDQDDVVDGIQVKVKKAYPAYFGSYRDFGCVQDYLSSLDGIYCIGRNGQHKYNNMDHSMLTAMEAVRALKGEVDKNIIWKVNTEHEYHEEAAPHK